MLGLSVGAGSPRSLRRPTKRLVQRIVLLSSQNETLASAEGHGPLTLRIAAPALHAGEYYVDSAALENGPMCLVLPEVSLTPEGAVAKPGLWACDPELGPVELTGQWAFEADPNLVRQGLTLALGADLAGRTTHYGETARQAGSTVVATSVPLILPEMPVQEPEPDLPPQDPVPELPSPPTPSPADPLPPTDDPVPEEPKLKVIYVDNGTFQLSADPTKPVSLTIDPPHPHAGNYLITPDMMAEMAFGPVCLVLPVISIDQKLTGYSLVKAGLWIFDSDRGSISVTRHWQQGNSLLAATDGQALAFEDRYRGVPIAMVERAVQADAERIAASAAITVPLNYRPADVFADVAVHNTPLQNYVGLSGESWAKAFEHSSNTVINKNTGRLEGGNSSGPSYIRGAADRGSRQFAEARVSHGGNANGSGYGIQVRAQGNNGYILAHTTAGTAFPNGALRLRRITNGAFSTIATIEGPFPWFAAKGDTATIRLEAEGNQLRLAFNDTWHGPYTDGTFTGGGVGVRTNGSGPGVLNSNTEIMSFSGGSL